MKYLIAYFRKSSTVVSSLRMLKKANAAVSTAGMSIFVVASTKAEKSAAITITAKSLKDHSHSVADALMFCGYMNCLVKLYLLLGIKKHLPKSKCDGFIKYPHNFCVRRSCA